MAVQVLTLLLYGMELCLALVRVLAQVLLLVLVRSRQQAPAAAVVKHVGSLLLAPHAVC